MGSMKKIRYGIIGYGGFAERAIAPAIIASPNSELVAIQKRSLGAAQEKAKALGISLAFDSVEDLVRHSDVDAVFVVSSNVRHAADTIAAARAGKHVLVEKPIAMNAGEARTMMEECRIQKVKLMVGQMVRLSPAIEWIRSLVHSGAFGKVLHIKTEYIYDARLSKRSWLYNRSIAGGGPLFDIGVHCLDTMRFLIGEEVISVKSQLNPDPTAERTEGTALAALRFASGIPGSIYVGFDAPFRRSILEIICSEGIVSVENFTQPGITVKVIVTRGEKGAPKEPDVEEIVVPDLYEKEVTLFSESIQQNLDSPIPAEEGLKNQIVLDEAMGTQ
jgi:1,5-anhydro-D-fructose reductase (1,5-anhydro-D-mannitol-forming)